MQLELSKERNRTWERKDSDQALANMRKAGGFLTDPLCISLHGPAEQVSTGL